MAAILGKKIGMTQIFNEAGSFVGVTAIEAGPCPVLAIKEKSVQVGFDIQKEKKVKRPIAGYFKKLNIAPRKYIKELLKDADKEYKVGDEIKVDVFAPGDFVNVTGITLGKGFQGGMKRWNWHGGPKTHGSTSFRRIGSIGSTTTPGRVFKGHHLPGHMGAVQQTTRNLKVVKVDVENNILLVKGAVPGNTNAYLIIRKSRKVVKSPPVGKKEAAKKK
jgi:large subunit ribosomal protein L3